VSSNADRAADRVLDTLSPDRGPFPGVGQATGARVASLASDPDSSSNELQFEPPTCCLRFDRHAKFYRPRIMEASSSFQEPRAQAAYCRPPSRI